METIFLLILLFICYLAIGMIGEAMFRKDCSLRQLANYLQADTLSILKGFFEAPKIPHMFADSLTTRIRNIVSPFLAVGMDIEITQVNNVVPFISIQFVPDHKLTDQELRDLSERIKIAFRKYLMSCNFAWRNFLAYNAMDYFVTINLYYAEFPDQVDNLRLLYQRYLIEKNGSDYGALRDEELDKELKEQRRKK